MDAFKADDVFILQTIAAQLAVAIVNAELHMAAEQQARTDSLTQVYNHGYLLQRLGAEVDAARASGQPLSLIMLDIDHFKQYNDRHGHMLGDQVLALTAQVIRQHIKHGDIVGRWGGEEFGIALPRTNLAQAMIVAQRIRRTLAAMALHDEQGNPIDKPTVSQGIASFPHHAATPEALVDCADRRLYEAKNNGRDQVATGDLKRDSQNQILYELSLTGKIQMNKRERLLAASRRQAVDRIPIALWRHFPGDDQRAADLAQATIAFQDKYDFDFVKVSPSNSYAGEDWGAQTAFRGNMEGTRDYVERPVKQPSDWRKLQPLDVTKGALGRGLETLRLLKSHWGENVPFIQTVFNPLMTARYLRGDTLWIADMREYPKGFSRRLGGHHGHACALCTGVDRGRRRGAVFRHAVGDLPPAERGRVPGAGPAERSQGPGSSRRRLVPPPAHAR